MSFKYTYILRSVLSEMVILLLKEVLLGFYIFQVSVYAQTQSLKCRSCSSAFSFSDCSALVDCDAGTQACFIQTVIKESLLVVFNAGCRNKSLCDNDVGVDRGDLIACDRCCNSTDDCNSNLCSLKQAHPTIQHRPSNSIKCRRCLQASSLSNCTGFIACDKNYEACYMDQVVNDNFEIVYDGGCRTREVCAANNPVFGKKKRDAVACSRCCNTADACNTHLCGIK